MPGLVCCFPKCGTKSTGTLGVFRITNRKNSFYLEWRKKTLDIIKRYRIVDANFQELLDKGKVAICERHYKKDIECTPTGKKTARLCALPTENLPKTSHATIKGPPRRVLLRAVNEVDLPTYSPPLSNSTNYIAGYKDAKDMRTAISIMKSTDISLQGINLETLPLKMQKVQKKEKKSKIPAKTKAPITKTDPLRLKQTLKLQRSEIL